MNRPVEATVGPVRDTTHEVGLMAHEAHPAARTLHVEPTAGGRWAVCYEHGNQALSDHLTANEAQYFAKQRARTEGIVGILVHDAYLRVHEVANFHVSTSASITA